MLLSTALVALGASMVAAVKPLSVKGTSFVDNDGHKFQIVGMAYQPGGSAGFKKGADPLSDPDTCLRDAALMQILGINTIRVYNVDPEVNHDKCVSIFNAAGMYMVIDVNTGLVGQAVSSYQPWTTYYAAYLKHTFAVVEAFSNYPNLLAFFSGNEVINDVPSAKDVPPYLRAVTRDLKNYIKNNIKRKDIPVGYSAADVRDVLYDTWNYMQCVEDDNKDDSQADLFALNSYSWCGPKATFESSTYNELVDNMKDTAIPVFFSEYGCIKPAPRYWNETHSIYGPDMDELWSGGIVYEWTQEDNGYGLINIKGDTANVLGDYNRFKDKISDLDWESLQSTKASSDKPKAPKCDSSLIKVKGFDSNFTLPVLPPGAQKLIDDGISPKPSGKIVEISDYNVKLTVKDSDGNVIKGLKVVPLGDDEVNWPGKNKAETGSSNSNSSGNSTSDYDSDGDKGNSSGSNSSNSNDDDDSAASFIVPAIWAAAVPALAMLLV